MPKVVFFTQLDPELHPLLTQHAPEDYLVEVARTDTPVSDKSALLRDADALILFPSRIEDEVLQSAKQLKHVQLVSAGFEHMNLDLIKELGLTISNNGGANSIDVAEQTMALILGVYRRLIDLDADVRNDRWYDMETGKCTYTIWNKTVGLIGLGNIGRRVARLLKPFDCELVYSDAYPAKPEVEAELGITRLDLPELLERSDIISLHVPFNDATSKMISTEQLALMKPNAIIINTCRGGVIDEPALTAALESKQIAFAGLDVLEREPPDADNPILKLDNVLLTPHSAGITRDTWDRRGQFVFGNIARAIAGDTLEALIG
jgi:phosphoglycerate dehydrogenase-like enzyme